MSRTGPIAATLAAAGACLAQPVQSPWPVEGPDDTIAVAAAAVSGWYAAADSFEDSVEIRDIRQTLLRTITRSEIQALLPWMSLGGGPDGPSALAWSDSGRVLYILVHDASPAGDGGGSDAVLAYDVSKSTLSVIARPELFNRDDQWPHLAVAHFAGRLYVGSATGAIRVYATAVSGSLSFVGTITLPGGAPVRGLAIDREQRTLFAVSDAALYRASIASTALPTLTSVGSLGPDTRGAAFSDHFGGSANAGLYVLRGSQILHAPTAQAYGAQPLSPAVYLTLPGEAHDLAATADGRLLIGTDEDGLAVSDASDSRLGFDAWLSNEFSQVVAFGRSLITLAPTPPGWVIDADTATGIPRFHPATPDAAAWTVLLLLAHDHVNGDPTARIAVRLILKRHAGLMSDGVAPSRTADGIFPHWIDTATGAIRTDWGDGYATLSTMKIVAAASRAAEFYPDDPEIALAASRIISPIRNWSAYVPTSPPRLYFGGAPGGGPAGVLSGAFNEGVLFVEQASAYGGAAAALAQWLNRPGLPSAAYVPDLPITGDSGGGFQSAFISLYPYLLSAPFRGDAAWRQQIHNLRWSNAAWTDAAGARFSTVFSAGTTRSDWGGYRADSLGSHPGDVTTFPSLMAFSAGGQTAEAVGAYHAYRRNARQTFTGGASILYRRSDVDRAYTPNSAGLPDVALGALGLAELLRPGTVDAVLARPYLIEDRCPVDVNADGGVNVEDLYALLSSPVDLNGDGAADVEDAACLGRWLRRHEAAESSGR